MSKLMDAIQSLRPNAKCVTTGETDVEWLDDEQVEPTQSEIDAEVIRLEAEYDAQEYARQRAVAYPSVGDQLDMLMKDKKNGTNTHQEACEAVKTKYPKS